MSKAFAYLFVVGAWDVFFGLVCEAFDDFVGVFARSTFLRPYRGSEGDAVGLKLVLDNSFVFRELGVGVVLNWVALCFLGL